ncbi:FkbM family methyltransferase [Hymenobacter taeanensis]|uniref:FkbM family methyltransferase n=1 Tax=Hymenobacter taeanensis TaxID=2735321 RepID=A0A6M6BKV2_9BACT|nr:MULTISPECIES: FkbM family methyltransferase [Hymenobacter]QJX48073.1 FkbM family methyltransferase [Hymenobacter taeanensis]UOQ82469.1 FkbM family methyltransferase [Hymenobacter sp. 5414T-23]
MNSLLKQLDEVEALANATKWRRLLHAPGKYLYAIGFRQLVYARTKKGLVKQVSTFFGMPMQVVLPAGTDIYLTGGKSHSSEIRLARFLINTLQPGDTFLDVGGHFGYFALLASRLVGSAGQVLAYEASRSTYAVLAENVKGQANIQAINQAVSDKQETISFYEFPVLYNEFNSMDVAQFADEKWFADFKPTRIDIPATRIDDILKASNHQPAVIKIDVEGAELKVIAGAAESLGHLRPYVVMEYLEPKRHNAEHQKAVALLQQLGYSAHSLNALGQPVPCADLNGFLQAHSYDSDNFVFIKQ